MWWYALGTVALVALSAGAVGGYLYGREELKSYQELQLLAKRRRLADSGRTNPARTNAGNPARVHTARVGTPANNATYRANRVNQAYDKK